MAAQENHIFQPIQTNGAHSLFAHVLQLLLQLHHFWMILIFFSVVQQFRFRRRIQVQRIDVVIRVSRESVGYIRGQEYVIR